MSALLFTSVQAFYVMHFFLQKYFNGTSSDSIGALLGCMHFLDDGETADPAFWEDWRQIVGTGPITPMQAFQAMNTFLRSYFQRTSSSNVRNMLNDILLVIDDKAGKEVVWKKWIDCVNQIF